MEHTLNKPSNKTLKLLKACLERDETEIIKLVSNKNVPEVTEQAETDPIKFGWRIIHLEAQQEALRRRAHRKPLILFPRVRIKGTNRSYPDLKHPIKDRSSLGSREIVDEWIAHHVSLYETHASPLETVDEESTVQALKRKELKDLNEAWQEALRKIVSSEMSEDEKERRYLEAKSNFETMERIIRRQSSIEFTSFETFQEGLDEESYSHFLELDQVEELLEPEDRNAFVRNFREAFFQEPAEDPERGNQGVLGGVYDLPEGCVAYSDPQGHRFNFRTGPKRPTVKYKRKRYRNPETRQTHFTVSDPWQQD